MEQRHGENRTEKSEEKREREKSEEEGQEVDDKRREREGKNFLSPSASHRGLWCVLCVLI